jgi:hypothetical protein
VAVAAVVTAPEVVSEAAAVVLAVAPLSAVVLVSEVVPVLGAAVVSEERALPLRPEVALDP